MVLAPGQDEAFALITGRGGGSEDFSPNSRAEEPEKVALLGGAHQ